MALGLSYPSVRRWYRLFRSQIPPIHQRRQLSGIVEVDEAYFGKRKFGHQVIVIGAIERDSKYLRLQIIPKAEQRHLETFINRHVKPGSIVVTDANPGYNDLNILGYKHETWNHSQGHFAGTNHIEQNWSAMKRYMRKLYGNVPTRDIQLILTEWEARHNRPEWFESVEGFLRLLVVPD
jgi:transposase-like protein